RRAAVDACEPGAMLDDGSLLRSGSYLDGYWLTDTAYAPLTVVNPSTGAAIATVTTVGRKETRQALASAYRALPAWRARSGKDRAKVWRRWFDLVSANAEA